MAIAMTSPPMLRLKRSAQSGTKAMAAGMQVVYAESSTLAYIFAGAEIDLSPMLAGDVIVVRIRTQIMIAGALVAHDQITFADARPVTHEAFHIGPLPNVYGVEIAMQQTAGVLRNIDCEFMDAKRIGLA